MKSYKEYENITIGFSDIAQLILRFSCQPPVELNFGGDGEYGAYIVDEDAEIGAHYHEVARGDYWAWIYDDYGKSLNIDTNDNAGEIVVYRAGDYGCIIQIIGGGVVHATNQGETHITETIDGKTVVTHDDKVISI